jgi:hypothetical protein
LSQSPIDLPSALALLQGRLQCLQLLDKLNNHKLLPSLQLHTDGPEVDVLRPGWRRLPRPSPGAPSARRLRGRIELPLMVASSVCGRPCPPRLPARAPWPRCSSAWAASWFQHRSEPSIALPLHVSPLGLKALYLLGRAHSPSLVRTGPCARH